MVDVFPQLLVVFDGGAHLSAQFHRRFLVQSDGKSVPQAHSGRERQIEILLIQVFGLYVDGLFVHGEQSHLAFIFGGFNAFHVLVVLRA